MSTRYAVIELDASGNTVRQINSHKKYKLAYRQCSFLSVIHSGNGNTYIVKKTNKG